MVQRSISQVGTNRNVVMQALRSMHETLLRHIRIRWQTNYRCYEGKGVLHPKAGMNFTSALTMRKNPASLNPPEESCCRLLLLASPYSLTMLGEVFVVTSETPHARGVGYVCLASWG